MRLFGTRPPSVADLRKDAQTPHGAIWSLFAPDRDLPRFRDGQLRDAGHVLSVGDVINVRTPAGGRCRYRLQVIGRREDLVSTRRIDH